MLCKFLDGNIFWKDFSGIILFENLSASNNLENPTSEIAIPGNVHIMKIIKKFYDKKYEIEIDKLYVKRAPQEALDYFQHISYGEWESICKMTAFIDYPELLTILILTGKLLFDERIRKIK